MSEYRMGASSRNAAQQASTQGLGLSPRPDGEIPKLPIDITELSDRALMTLYAEFSAWYDFAAHQLACAVIDEKAAERRADAIERNQILKHRVTGANVTDSRAAAKTDDDVMAAQTAHFEAEAYRRMIEALTNTCERNAAVISRELTRRTSSPDRTRRLGAWTT